MTSDININETDLDCGPEMKAGLLEVINGNRPENHDNLRMIRREVVSRPTIFVGTGTCGLGAGAGATLKDVKGYVKRHEIEADIIEVGCIGLCACEPLMDVQIPGRPRLSFKHVTSDRVHTILDAVLDDELTQEILENDVLMQFEPAKGDTPWDGVVKLEDHPFFGPQTRWVLENCGLVDPARVSEYVARGGYTALAKTIHNVTPEEVCGLVEESGLRGRGGGGFKTGMKWRFALNAQANQKYIICNADEGDPGAFMDRAVIEGDPHRLVEGMALAAYAIGATKGYIYIRAEYPLAIQRLKDALKVARNLGLLGHNILDSGFDFDIKIKEGAGAFVCGEETALINSIEGKRGMPRPRPPYPAVKGLFGKPTIINNVETLSNLPILMRNGAEWFASVGTDGSKGTKVFALSGKVVNTGLVEIPMGTTIENIVMKIGGGIPGEHEFKAVQIGGPSGGCIPSQHIDTVVDYESLKTVGAMMGSGGLVVMDENTCMVDLAKFFMDFIQRESCGKCIPCREGTRRMLEILQRITRGRSNEKDVDALERFQGVVYLERLGEVIKDTSLCGLGQTAPNPVLSTLRWFREEYEEHIYERKCRAGVCTELLNYSIDADKCIGCTLCARHCPTEAIMGAPKSPHYIIEDKCIGCGTCLTNCRHGAVIAR